jgi:hypothetical protein
MNLFEHDVVGAFGGQGTNAVLSDLELLYHHHRLTVQEILDISIEIFGFNILEEKKRMLECGIAVVFLVQVCQYYVFVKKLNPNGEFKAKFKGWWYLI